ncbi:hypothetical protein EII29_08425 [Leptotrichia sp. OH3620_COT-345]|uniref:hypothetical protein n=1 Tax=Leptotrichia sp. OH3620_COT-345 TaxID=2491048 RepID=UPI000F652A6C|nr:hypothetical protein [Leptotrichia sp. OH3620_COT-345]RRD39131.1 hypothetical protein EII29_08425 [Leptotrichia sp. OH3620_COT-345]
MTKKIIMAIFAILISNIGLAITNEEIISQGAAIQKAIFDKHFNKTPSGTSRKDSNLLNSVFPEIITNLDKINRNIYDREFNKLASAKENSRKSLFRKMYVQFNEYIVENSKFSRSIFSNFLQEKDDLQAYLYTNIYLSIEAFNLNMNTYLEGQKNSETIEPNIKTVIDYLYYNGDEKSKEDYQKMSNGEIAEIVDKEYIKLYEALEKRISEGNHVEKKMGNNARTSLKKMEKFYRQYDKSFEEYIDGSGLKKEDKEKIKKLVKFENIASLKFMTKSLEKLEGEESGQ